MYRLESENLTGLGSAMGTERTWRNFTKYFSTEESAKKYAEKDYQKVRPDEQLKWSVLQNMDGSYKRLSTGDLRWVMYSVFEVNTEE